MRNRLLGLALACDEGTKLPADYESQSTPDAIAEEDGMEEILPAKDLAIWDMGTVDTGDVVADTNTGDGGVAELDIPPTQDVPEDSQKPETVAGYAVHEWGVLSLERATTAPTLFNSMDDKPVLYFYSEEPLIVEASVTFTQGTGRETWPEVTLGGTLSWEALEIGAGPCQQWSDFPGYGEGQCPYPWEEACEATFLSEYVVPDASCVTLGPITSPLLFYAGTNTEPVIPLTGSYAALLSDTAEVSVEFTTQMQFVDRLFVVYRDLSTQDTWEQPVTVAAQFAAAVVDVNQADPTATYEVLLTPEAVDFGVDIPTADAYETLVGQFHLMLRNQGLTQDETDAFMAAWAPMFFGVQARNGHPYIAPGTSVWVIGVHSQGDFDALMPLTLSPAPESINRVLVSYTQLD